MYIGSPQKKTKQKKKQQNRQGLFAKEFFTFSDGYDEFFLELFTRAVSGEAELVETGMCRWEPTEEPERG